MYVYANSAYLKLFGYKSFSDLEGVPILDMVNKRDQTNFTSYLYKVTSITLEDATLPSTRLTMLMQDGSEIDVIATSHSYVLNNESCVEIWLRPNRMPTSHIKKAAINWRYYLSLAFTTV